MELVRGIKITDYCDQANLSTKERLDLFIKVCQAIQHAHQKGIIHRDIKPSNILVTLHDGVPVPKVIDFGIAKATEGRLVDATVYTQLHQFNGHAGLHVAGAGGDERVGRGHALGHLQPGSVALPIADQQDAFRREGTAGAGH
jgi:serine/threonine protein kinase